MKILYINAAFRDGSRTARLAEAYLGKCTGEISTVDLGTLDIRPLQEATLRTYNASVEQAVYDDPMFALAKEFVEADQIVIAAPFWNFTLPAILHDYLELVCTQGISFDVSDKGEYYSLCKAQKITYITTAGGFIPDNDHAFGYIRDLAEFFWHIPEVNYYKAEGLDIYGTDVEAKLAEIIAGMKDS